MKDTPKNIKHREVKNKNLKYVFAKTLREARGKESQSKIAEYVNCSQPDISAYENPESEKLPNLDTAVSLSNVLDISLDELCGLDEKQREITPFQWLVFLDTLISNPPAINEKPLIEIKQAAGSTSIVFSGNGMNEYFKQYLSLRSVNLDEDIYSAAIKNLFDKYAVYFTPGMKTLGVKTPAPPKGELS